MNAMTALRTGNRVLGNVAPGLAAQVARGLLLRPSLPAAASRPNDAAAVASATPVTFRFGLTGLRWGTGGPVVLMLHGWGGRATQFHPLAVALAAQGMQAISLDGPAHGRARHGLAHPLSFAEALLEAAAELRDVHAVVGHSMGAAAALFALSEGLAVNCAVSVAAASNLQGVLGRFAAALALPSVASRRFIDGVERVVGRPSGDLDVRRVGQRLRVPGLIVHDAQDREVPYDDARHIAAAWPGARLMTTQGLGHNRVLRDPAVIRAVVDFAGAYQPMP